MRQYDGVPRLEIVEDAVYDKDFAFAAVVAISSLSCSFTLRRTDW